MRKIVSLLVLSALTATAGCSPVQQFYMKEKVTNAAPRPGIQVDRFAYNKAMGATDVLFVVDNTESGIAAMPAFQKSYTDFVGRFGRPEARLLDYRVQVVTDPMGAAPGDFASNASPPNLQLAELFGGSGSDSPPLLVHSDPDHAEHGFLNPFTSAAAGLATKAFAGHDSAPVFVVFILGDDSDPTGSLTSDAATFAAAIRKSRGFHQTHLVSFSRLSDPGARGASAFPHCDNFYPAPSAVGQLQALPWRSQKKFDLCDGAWPSFSDTVFPAIVDFKKKLVLSHTPDAPETMLLRSATHLYRYGDDYRLDQQNNEIVFLRANDLQEGDLLDVSYYLPVGETVLSNGQTPPGPIPASGH